METNVKEIAKFISNSVNDLVDSDEGCCTKKLDGKLAVCVGWSSGFGNDRRDDVIQSKTEPDFGICAGVKVWTSDDMRTDFDWINFPYCEDGEVLDMSLALDPKDTNDDYMSVAETMLKWYNDVKDFDIEEDGKIVNDSVDEDLDIGTEKYRVEHAHWVEGSGWSYNETIDNCDRALTSEELGKYYEDYCDEGDEIRLIDNETDELVSLYECSKANPNNNYTPELTTDDMNAGQWYE